MTEFITPGEFAMLPRCVISHKVGYADEAKARVALANCIQARKAEGRSRRMERDVYECACGLWHLTRNGNDPLDADDLLPLIAALRHRFR